MTKGTEANSMIAGFGDCEGKFGPGDIVVIGAGLAGLFTALKLAPLPVTVVSAAPLGEGASSVWAQGGIAAAVGEGDTAQAHAADTIAAGAGLVEEAVAKTIAGEAGDRIRDLLGYGVPFDRSLEGSFVLSREAAHSAKRVVRVAGDRAGAAIMQALIATVRKTPSIRVLEGYEAEDLIVEDGRVAGVRMIRGEERGNGAYTLMPAAAVVVATGGVGGLYAVTTNPAYARGEAIAIAARAGAIIADAEFVQFHPTAFDIGLDPAPLATEALRGEGAKLVNGDGHRFMTDLHRDAELAPRDIVARGVFAEIAAGRGAFLDCRQAIGADLAKRFPTVYGTCMEAGLDPARDLLPIAPAAHYHMGGIATNLDGRSSLNGLWAVGEVGCTGLHGANRLASNSLLEAVVVAARAASDIAALSGGASDLGPVEPRRIADGVVADRSVRAELLDDIRRTMSRDVGVVRDRAGLRRAFNALTQIERAAGGDTVLSNMALAARFIAGAALMRRESRGAHYRSDCPVNGKRAKHSLLRLAEINALSQLTNPDEAVRDAACVATPAVTP
ncbi:MAG: L-aspartate oxidase [Alphaproteobacteria bacterium]|nr:L-aspartate oxidase [Alphaproteobacteria bacterium]